MELNRRSFLFGAGAVVSASALTPIASVPKLTPILYGDGEHDDTSALRALFAGKDVALWREGEGVILKSGPNVLIQGGEYLVSGGLHLRDLGVESVEIRDAAFLLDLSNGESCINVHPGRQTSLIADCAFIGINSVDDPHLWVAHWRQREVESRPLLFTAAA